MVQCLVDGCEAESMKRGMCYRHYKRWYRHGGPTKGRTQNGATMQFLQYAAACNDGPCLTWPYAVNESGYGVMRYHGRLQLVSRAVCIEKHGPPPTNIHEAAHSCGRGSLGCVNGSHISWKTPTENQRDKHLHGTDNRGDRHPMAKLTTGDVRKIFFDRRPAREVALEFGISLATVSDIRRRRSWSWLDMTREYTTG